MPQAKPRVVVTRKLPAVIETRMMELFDTRLNLDDRPLGPAGLAAAQQLASHLEDFIVRYPTHYFSFHA